MNERSEPGPDESTEPQTETGDLTLGASNYRSGKQHAVGANELPGFQTLPPLDNAPVGFETLDGVDPSEAGFRTHKGLEPEGGSSAPEVIDTIPDFSDTETSKPDKSYEDPQ